MLFELTYVFIMVLELSWIFGGREKMISFIPKALEERFKDFQEELVVDQEMLNLDFDG